MGGILLQHLSVLAAIQETLFFLAVSGMRESIHAGMAEPASACATELDWWVGISGRSALQGRSAICRVLTQGA